MTELALGALAIGLALHGLGRLVGWLVDDAEAPAALTIAWGLALYLALAGWLAAFGVFDRHAQIAVVMLGVGLGPVWALRRTAAGDAWRPGRETLVAVAIAGLLAVQVAGAAGLQHAAWSDGDGDLRGPLAHLAQTGAVGDAAGAARGAGLGGTTLLLALGWVFGDVGASHAVDALGLALAIALASGAGGRGPTRPYLGFAVAALALGMPALPLDLAPRWTLVALLFALHATLQRATPDHPRRALVPLVLAAAVAALVHGGLGVVAVVVVAAPRRTATRHVLVVAAALGGHALAFGRSGATLAPALPRAALGLVAAAVVWALLSALLRAPAARPLAVTIAALAAALVPTAGFADSWMTVAWLALPFALAGALLVVVVGLRALDEHGLGPVGLIAALGVALVLSGLRVRVGAPPRSWGERSALVIDAARAHAGRGRAAIAQATYRAAFATIPAGARVGLWVDRADLVDYRRHHVIDLRSARPRRSRGLAALDLAYMVVAPSAPLAPDDALHAVVRTGETISAGDLTVIRVRR